MTVHDGIVNVALLAVLCYGCAAGAKLDVGFTVDGGGDIDGGGSNGSDGSSFGTPVGGCGSAQQGCICSSPGATSACWTGLATDRGVGACHDGMATCMQVGEFAQWGPCEGEVLDCGGTCGDGGLPNPMGSSCRRLAVASIPQYSATKPTRWPGRSSGVCVVTESGAVKCAFNPPNTAIADPAQTLPNMCARCISGGESFMCVVTGTGGVWCWGPMDWNLGLYNYYPADAGATPITPTAITGIPPGVIDIAAGESHACVLTNTGKVACWGPVQGETNSGSVDWPKVPTVVSGLASPAIAIASGDGFSCAVLGASGKVQCWGNNKHGELGNGTTSDSANPVDVLGLPAAAVGVWADGAEHPCALLSDGSVWCWGTTNQAAFFASPPPGPTQVKPFAAGVTAVSAGGEISESCALLTNGGVQCWGDYTVLVDDGGASSTQYSEVPFDVLPSGSGAVELRSNDDDYCALLADGGVTCWGQGWQPSVIPGLP